MLRNPVSSPALESPSPAPIEADEPVPLPTLAAAATAVMSGGAKRPFVGEAPSSPSSGGSAKRHRLASYSSTASASSSTPLFSHLHDQIVENLDIAFKRLSSLQAADEYATPLSHQDENGASTVSQLSPNQDEQKVIELDLDGLRLEQAVAEKGPEAQVPFENYHIPFGVRYWVDMIAREINIGSDGRAGVTGVLKELEMLIRKEISKLIHEMEARARLVETLKAGVISLSEYKEAFIAQSQELQKSRQLESEYEEELQDLKMKNYDLEMRLKNELQRSPIPDRFHRDVF